MPRKEFEQLHIKSGEMVVVKSKATGVRHLSFTQISLSGNSAIFDKLSAPFETLTYEGKNFIGWHCFALS